MHAVTQYAIAAVSRTIIVGETERLACRRHLNDLARAGQLAQKIKLQCDIRIAHDKSSPWRFDEKKADRVIEFFRYLRHVEGFFAGEPIELIEAHKFDLGCLFGWVHKGTGIRRFKKAYIQVGKKNAKTTLLGGVCLYMMVGDGEQSPRVYTAAVDREQARLLFESARSMALESPDISKRLKIGNHKIVHRTRGGVFMPISKDSKNKQGRNPSCVVIDEYADHTTSIMVDVFDSAKGQRAQPLVPLIITTAGNDTESPCYSEYLYCKDILTGKIKDDRASERYFIMIRELDKDDDESDPQNWVKSNPLRCLIPQSFEELEEQHDTAFGSQLPEKVREFRVRNLNIWVHGNEATYMGNYMVAEGGKPSKWDRCGVTREEFLRLTQGAMCIVGVDLSKKIDLTALGYAFALKDGRIAVSAHGFIPEAAVIRHEKTDHIPYSDWAKAGWVTITDGDVVDYQRLMDQIEALNGQLFAGEWPSDPEDPARKLLEARALAIHYAALNGWQVHEICYDPYNATHFKNEMDELGYTTVEVRQTMPNLNEPTKFFREQVADGKLVHDGSPLLTWCVSNAQEIIDSKENIMISKKKALDTRRVDLLAATIDALFRIQPLRDATNYQEYVKSKDFGF